MCVHAQLYPIPCDPMDCSPPGSSVHGIFQARILEWVAISSSNKPGFRPRLPCLRGEGLGERELVRSYRERGFLGDDFLRGAPRVV